MSTGQKKSTSDEVPTSKSPEPEASVAASKASRRDERYEKSDFVVQWDPQEGLMPQILSLISSPKKDVRKKKNNILIIGSNRECSSCGEGGDLVCCGNCNSCFHTLCHNPPLDDDNLPQSKWICFSCSKTNSEQPTVIAPTNDSEAPRLSRAFDHLLKAIEFDNSEEFQLTKEVSLPFLFAGHGKPSKRRLKQMKLSRLDQGLVNTPVQVCFTCEKSSRKGPLLQCDFCPLMFHLDCLNPPLTTLPMSRWMCPNHPNHAVDEKLVSDRHTERVKLWDQFCCNSVTEQKVMLDFFHKNSRKDPPFRRKRLVEPDVIPVAVPSHIKAMYRAAKKRREQNDWLDGIIQMNPRVLDFENLTVSDLSDTTVKLLATRMLAHLQPQKKETTGIPTVNPKAFITPGLGSSGPQLYITHDHITVGRCSSADINLEYYGSCRYASSKHAVIFYDKFTDRYELINYSQYGTHVDGISYDNNLEQILKESRSLTNHVKMTFTDKKLKTKIKRPPMKRGRKSKAEKAAMAAAAAQLSDLADDLMLNGNQSQKNACVQNGSVINSEETVSVADQSTLVVPKSENSDSETAHDNNNNDSNDNEHKEGIKLGEINGAPKECICDLNNIMGKQPPIEGHEGTALLHNGSVLKFGCIVLLFNIVE